MSAYELYVASAADFREVMKRYPAHKLSLVSFWTSEDDQKRDDTTDAYAPGGPAQGSNGPGPSVPPP
eukprot:2129693-Amphidinium_carterae.2